MWGRLPPYLFLMRIGRSGSSRQRAGTARSLHIVGSGSSPFDSSFGQEGLGISFDQEALVILYDQQKLLRTASQGRCLQFVIPYDRELLFGPPEKAWFKPCDRRNVAITRPESSPRGSFT